MLRVFFILSIVTVSTAWAADNAAKHSFEYKVTMDSLELQKILSAQDLEWEKNPEKRAIYFFDDSDLTLYRQSLLLRVRMADAVETTAKVRPIDYETVDKSWLKNDGFKCETDVQKRHHKVPSCSFSENESHERLKAVLRGERTPKALYSKKQEKFVDEFATSDIDWESLVVLGPIQSRAWHGHFKKPGLNKTENKITLELWVFGKKGQEPQNALELSVGAKKKKSFEKKRAWLLELIRKNEWHAHTDQETKTRQALRYFTGKTSNP